MVQHERWAALRRMQIGAVGRTTQQQIALAHDDALAFGIEDESEKYFGYLTGWLGSVRWALGKERRLSPKTPHSEQHLAMAHDDALALGIRDRSNEYVGYKAGWLGAVIHNTKPDDPE